MPHARYIIRWDDISPYQDKERFQSLVELFLGYEIPATLGIIPENQDLTIQFANGNQMEFVHRLKELEKVGWEIAQHGYRHIKNSDDGGVLNLNSASEFAGRRYSEQLDDLLKGKSILIDYGFNPVTFIPPWHSYDTITLKALAKAGFKVLSDGLFLFPRMTCSLLHLPMIFWSVPRRIRALNLLGSIYTVCLHPHLISDHHLRELERFFRDEKPQVVTASSLLEEADRLTRPSIKKKILDPVFVKSYKKVELQSRRI
jgi:predicted deacetylase